MSDDMSMVSPSSAGEHGVLRSMQEVAMSSQEASKMLRTYNIAWWGNNYYDVNELGHISVCPDPDVPEARVDLAELVKAREAQGQRLPALFCFPQILQHRLRSINAAFKRARESYGYNGDYFLVYPIKVNQHRRVIESLIHSGEPLGLEAGSKAELMAVLAHAGMTRSVIVCNGYKDREYIRLALVGEKMGHKVYLVIEKMSEIAIVLEEAERLNVVDCGDLVYAFGDAREMSEKLQAHAEKLLAAGKRMLSFGGDHFVTLPLLRAHAKHFGKMALVHFDAHTDTYANGCEFDHGTMFYTAPNEGLIDPNHSVQIGIRTEFDKDNGFTVLDAGQVNDRSVDDVIAQVKQIVGDMPVYLTFDIDCLDPAFAPGTGTPVIGGLTSDRAIKLVRGLKDLNIVGMDVVEVAPAYDQSEITALAAATLALEMLYIQAAKKGE
ncbi:TPA: agmatinase [Klebsiella pneumoniae]